MIHVALVFATVLAPLTMLRFSFFGVSELVLGLIFIQQAAKGVRAGLLSRFPLTKFWLVYVMLCLVGAAVNQLLLSEPSSTLRSMAFDLSAYVFILITCFALERLHSHQGLDTARLIQHIFLWGGSLMTVLYVISRFRPTLFGYPLLYYGRFAPFAENIHQISMFLVPLPFFGFMLLLGERRFWLKILAAILIPTCAVMAISTGSTKGLMAVVTGVLVLVYAYTIKAAGRPLVLLVNTVYLAAFVVAAYQFDLGDLALNFFSTNDGGGARQFLYSNAITLGMESFLVGRGPGAHITYVQGQFSDAHQTLLTVFLQAGIAGVILFGFFAVRVYRQASIHPALLAAFSAIAIYALGGDVLRRLPIWVMIFVIVHNPLAHRRRAENAVRSGVRHGAVVPQDRLHIGQA